MTHTNNKVAVNIAVTQTSSYCGGAEPPDYVLQELATPRPLGGQLMFVRRGDVNDVSKPIIGEYTSDASGKVEMALEPGIYCLIFKNRRDRSFVDDMLRRFAEPSSSYSAVDMDCLESWLLTPELVFEVKQDGSNSFHVNYHSPCSWDQWPCVSYFGPLPP